MTQENHSHSHDGHDHSNHAHSHSCDHESNRENEHDHGHSHGGHDQDNHAHIHTHESVGKKRAKIKIKNVPGMIRIKRNIHDEAIVISGELTVTSGVADVNAVVASELENASAEITRLEGIVGHIKASVTITKTGMVSVTEDKAMIKEAQVTSVRISIAAIVFLIVPEVAEEIVRKSLSGMRKRLSS